MWNQKLGDEECRTVYSERKKEKEIAKNTFYINSTKQLQQK